MQKTWSLHSFQAGTLCIKTDGCCWEWQVSTLVREEEEAYHAEDIVYPLRRLAANEPDLDASLVRQSSMYGECLGSLTCEAGGARLSFSHCLLGYLCAAQRSQGVTCPWTGWLLAQCQGAM